MVRSVIAQALACGLVGVAACSTPATEHAGSASTIRVCWPRDPESLMPLSFPNSYAVQIHNLLYQSLLLTDGPTRRYVPWLAEQLPLVERRDSLTYLHYRLRPQARWDNQQPILARDVVFSLKLLSCPGLPNESQRGTFSFIKDVLPDATNPRNFTLVCRGYAPEFRTSSGEFPVLPEYVLDPRGHLRQFSLPQLRQPDSILLRQPAVRALQQEFARAARWRDPRVLRGSGPYELVSWQAGQHLVLARKARWWADALSNTGFPLVARPQRLEFHVVPAPATALLALRRGELDVYPNMPGADFARLRTADSTRFHFFTPASYRVVVLETNTEQTALRDARTRQALGYLLDAGQLMRATQYGQGQLTTGLISPQERWAYHDSLPLRRFDPARAAQLLGQAGWQRSTAGWQKPGQPPLTLRLYYGAGDRTYETIALSLQQAARQLNLPVTLHPTEGGQLSELRRDGRFDLCLRTLYGNPFSYDLRPLLHTSSIGTGGVNRTRFGNAASDHLLETIVATADSTQKARLLHKLQTMLYQEAPLIPLFFEPNRLAVARQFGQVRASGIEPGYDLPSFTSGAH